MKKFLLFILTIFLCWSIAFSQSSDGEIEKEYVFTADSKTTELSAHVSENTTVFIVSVEGEIKKGTMKISLISPDGERSGGFELKADVKSKSNSNVSVNTNSNSNSNSNSNNNSNTTVMVVSNSSSGSKGNMNRVLVNPETGTWIVKIVPDKAEGKLKIHIKTE